jgi:plastocyanin
MLRRAGLLAVLALALAGAAPDTATVTIDNFAFGPAELTVPVGTTVTWTNRDDIPHTVTSGDTPRLFKSEPLDTDEHFAYRFDHAGRFAYFCSLHAHMQGVIVVK